MDFSAFVLTQMGDVTYWMAFLAGLGSFLSPCVLPLIPAWLTLATGLSYEELAGENKDRLGFMKMFAPTLLFVLGFSLVFCLLGVAAGLVGELLTKYRHVLSYVSGAFIIFFGLYLTGLISPAFLMREKRVDIRHRPLGLAGSFVVGLGFAAGWTPCIGGALTPILFMAANEQSGSQGLRLLGVYCLALGLPFLLVSLSWGAAWSVLSRLRPVIKWSGKVMGGLMIVLGILVMGGWLNLGLPQSDPDKGPAPSSDSIIMQGSEL